MLERIRRLVRRKPLIVTAIAGLAGAAIQAAGAPPLLAQSVAQLIQALGG